jgi:hypothetical protein
MTAHVDDWCQSAPDGSTEMVTLLAGPDDGLEELHRFAAGIGLRRECSRTSHGHSPTAT